MCEILMPELGTTFYKLQTCIHMAYEPTLRKLFFALITSVHITAAPHFPQDWWGQTSCSSQGTKMVFTSATCAHSRPGPAPTSNGTYEPTQEKSNTNVLNAVNTVGRKDLLLAHMQILQQGLNCESRSNISLI